MKSRRTATTGWVIDSGRAAWATADRSMDSQHHLAEHVSALQARVRRGGLGEWILGSDGHLQLRADDRLIQLLELLRPGDGIEAGAASDFDARLGLGTDS